MGEKDITEKTLESYNDVFADILNALLFNGKQVVDPNDLEDQNPHSFYKADGKLRELERDVVKRWKRHNIRIACIGMENQTDPDPYMVLRVAGYNGTEYRIQINNLPKGEKPYLFRTKHLGTGILCGAARTGVPVLKCVADC